MKTNFAKVLRAIAFVALAATVVVTVGACGKSDKNKNGYQGNIYPGGPIGPGGPRGPGGGSSCMFQYCAMDNPSSPTIVLAVNLQNLGQGYQRLQGQLVFPAYPYGCRGFQQMGQGMQVYGEGSLSAGMQIGPGIYVQGVVLGNQGKLNVTISDGFCQVPLY